jgi:hypothetical protein
VLNVPVAKPRLQRAGVVTGVRQRIAAAVPQHVRVRRECHLRALADPAAGGKRRLFSGLCLRSLG